MINKDYFIQYKGLKVYSITNTIDKPNLKGDLS